MLEFNFLGIPLLEWIGYAASVLVLVSLTMTSIVKLRWYNLAGAVLFSAYGFLIGALPVGIMNFLIVCANLYNLRKMYSRIEDFKIIEIKKDDELLKHLLEFHAKDITTFFPDFQQKKNQLSLFILRDMSIAGIFIGTQENNEFRIDLDYALPQYRDFKVGNYLYKKLNKILGTYQVDSVYCVSKDFKYMEKMGFEAGKKQNEDIMIKSLKKPL
ncbi:hypothetical protein ACT3CE_06310 [Marinifilum sp. RC60d5]|uniref:hypothetical protein n=1 Tax=Marinifilum sp. RC60d5 TaxID=3458414 RepID=UPI004036CC37